MNKEVSDIKQEHFVALCSAPTLPTFESMVARWMADCQAFWNLSQNTSKTISMGAMRNQNRSPWPWT